MNTRPYYAKGIKLAVARWREAIYSGELGPESAEKLKAEMGLTPRRLRKGLTVGSENILRRYGYGLELGSAMPLTFPVTMEVHMPSGTGGVAKGLPRTSLVEKTYSPEIQRELRAVHLRHEADEVRRTEQALQRAARKDPRFGTQLQDATRTTQDLRAKVKALNSPLERQLLVAETGLPRLPLAEQVLEGKQFHPMHEPMQAIARRGVVQKTRWPAWKFWNKVAPELEQTPVLAGAHAHADPTVVLNEQRNVRMLSPETRRTMEGVRRPREGALIRKVTGKQLPRAPLPRHQINQMAAEISRVSEAGRAEFFQNMKRLVRTPGKSKTLGSIGNLLMRFSARGF